MSIKGFQCFSLLTFLASEFAPFYLLCLYSSSFCTCRNNLLEQNSLSVVLSSCNQDHTSTCSNNSMEIKALYTFARSFSHRLNPFPLHIILQNLFPPVTFTLGVLSCSFSFFIFSLCVWRL